MPRKRRMEMDISDVCRLCSPSVWSFSAISQSLSVLTSISHLSFTYFNYWVNWSFSYFDILIFFEEIELLEKNYQDHHLISMLLKMGADFFPFSDVCTVLRYKKGLNNSQKQYATSKTAQTAQKNISFHIFYLLFQ